MIGGRIQIDRERAHASLHALSQPLTVMSLALTIVQGSADETERMQALEAMVTECQRAMRSVYQLRTLLEDGGNTDAHAEVRNSRYSQDVDWIFGGMA